MKVYTKTGDKGQTGLYSGKRIPKFHQRVEAYGTVDELNSFLGLLRDHIEDDDLRTELLAQQNHLFALGAALADDRPGQAYELPASAATDLEHAIDRMDADLPKMTHFVLPGGAPVLSHAHICRTICRRAERRVVELATDVEIDGAVIIYLNRLSDYFFVLSRHLARVMQIEEVKWIS
ncbi:cob(I)yrinic acid a,c-diamide adenosyltransferase [Neolewinella antarctica]|uniref:Corrinoid adenosyltransferase n=1 Tax=Neolewinella antarctica TaxID=442734 RepID=A0ABX0X7W8_9BACT|nr:cob(I)yrinic acid a,c-diamide adenosyltransferase [Neolewinella antarctica]NJC25079.1 cob(I)alamin adenosyltransferase [Neolewinella antarctica]